MGKDSGIQWTNDTFNPWRGCTRVSEACRFCYAETLSKRNPAVLGVWGPQGTRVVASESKWREPLGWNKIAKASGVRRRVFCASLADIFEDWGGFMVNATGQTLHVTASNDWKPGPLKDGRECGFTPVTIDDVRARLFDLILATPHLDWLLLTKRPEVAKDYLVNKSFGGLAHQWGEGWSNVWLGVTVENKGARERIKTLLSIPAAIHWISAEPLLEEIDITLYLYSRDTYTNELWPYGPLDWAICGGESGSKRNFDLQWARSLRDECFDSQTAFFMKQMGANPVETIRPGLPELRIIDLEDSHGGDQDEWPEDLRVRQFPTTDHVLA